jgi:hydroxylaminobenzene mutase
MEPTAHSIRQAALLARVGLPLILLALVVGIPVPRFTVPRLALSAHLLGVLQALYLLVVGLLWPRLRFTAKQSWPSFWLLVYGCVAALAANLLGALWGAGNTLLPLSAATARGSSA